VTTTITNSPFTAIVASQTIVTDSNVSNIGIGLVGPGSTIIYPPAWTARNTLIYGSFSVLVS
jgi:hypothetical protein